MTKNLNLNEELEYWDKFSSPFLAYIESVLIEKKRVSYDIFSRKPEELLLVDSFGFGIDSIFAGLTEIQIEYFAKKAPMQHKKELISIFGDESMMRGVWEIAKAMDDDNGDGSNKNQERIKRVIQYIKDNIVIFQF